MPDYEPWQLRIIEEKTALDVKLAKLNEFMNGEKFAGLDEWQRAQLRSQRFFMFGYSEVLGQRIADFSTQERIEHEPI